MPVMRSKQRMRFKYAVLIMNQRFTQNLFHHIHDQSHGDSNQCHSLALFPGCCVLCLVRGCVTTIGIGEAILGNRAKWITVSTFHMVCSCTAPFRAFSSCMVCYRGSYEYALRIRVLILEVMTSVIVADTATFSEGVFCSATVA
ncbi:hypothetical protein MRB53_038906 [Persea americana]|nr:hypothetical protein MRB53_038906 [Persea americana]